MHNNLTPNVVTTTFRPFSQAELTAMTPPTIFRAPSILCVGNDPILLHTRQLLLGKNGYRVVAWSVTELLKQGFPPTLNGIVICHSVSGEELNQLLGWLEQRIARDRIVLTEPLYGFQRSFEGYGIAMSERPESLLHSLSKLIRPLPEAEAT